MLTVMICYYSTYIQIFHKLNVTTRMRKPPSKAREATWRGPTRNLNKSRIPGAMLGLEQCCTQQ